MSGGAAGAADRRNTERDTINRVFSAKISIVLKYLYIIDINNCINIEYNSEYKYKMLHNRLLQDKEMTVRLDWSKWTCVPAENSSPVG